ncbi:MAG TPA: YajQ family cyclic di-GMP-binding protein [bacterium]|nr:YajQ family cyclic di-GMP-binding protein [bacterium]
MPTFDVMNKLEMSEVTNAVEQARKEVGGRYDFKGTNTAFDLDDKKLTVTIRSTSADRINAAYEVLLQRMSKRNISVKALDPQADEELPGGTVKRVIKLKNGIDAENAKKITGMIKERFSKNCQASINGDLVRVSSKSKDALQEVMGALRVQDLPVPIAFGNFRD